MANTLRIGLLGPLQVWDEAAVWSMSAGDSCAFC